MTLSLLALLGASLSTLTAPRDPAQELHVPCPAGATTRLLLPEPLRQLQVATEERVAMGLSVERSRPTAVLRLAPPRHPARARLVFRGPRLVLRLLLETSPSGSGGDVRVVWPPVEPAARPNPAGAPHAASTPPTPPTPTPTPEPTAAPTPLVPPPTPAPPVQPATVQPATPRPPRPVPRPTPSPSPTPAVAFDLGDLMRATPVPIGRREGLPGQLPLVLVDALKGESSVWLRFTLEGGAGRRVQRATWEHGPISAYTQEPVGRDLRIVVQLPKQDVSRKSRLQIELEGGDRYRVGLSSSTLAGFLKSLFQ